MFFLRNFSKKLQKKNFGKKSLFSKKNNFWQKRKFLA
jgi:hypothetical protein